MPAGIAVHRHMRNSKLLGRKAPRKREVIAEYQIRAPRFTDLEKCGQRDLDPCTSESGRDGDGHLVNAGRKRQLRVSFEQQRAPVSARRKEVKPQPLDPLAHVFIGGKR